jgi:hypothetical protein
MLRKEDVLMQFQVISENLPEGNEEFYEKTE